MTDLFGGDPPGGDFPGGGFGGPPQGAPDEAPQQIRILAQFIRDLSFENPRAPDSLRMAGEQPNIDLGVEMNARGRPDGYFEVDLKLTAKASREGDTAFQIELLYGGLFELAGFSETQLEMILLIECPRFMFPYARRIISDMTAEGGFPPLHLDPIDFAAVYAARNQSMAGGSPVAGHA